MKPKCSRCGSCCQYFVIANERNLTTTQKEYMEKRADMKFGYFYMVHAPCKHMVSGTEEDPRTTCKIYKTRPKLCRDYNGKPQHGKQKFAVPPGCAMAYGSNEPSGNSNVEQKKES